MSTIGVSREHEKRTAKLRDCLGNNGALGQCLQCAECQGLHCSISGGYASNTRWKDDFEGCLAYVSFIKSMMMVRAPHWTIVRTVSSEELYVMSDSVMLWDIVACTYRHVRQDAQCSSFCVVQSMLLSRGEHACPRSVQLRCCEITPVYVVLVSAISPPDEPTFSLASSSTVLAGRRS